MSSIDYRNRPSAGTLLPKGIPAGSSTGTYDQPTPADAENCEPWTDQTWQGFDSADDAIRFRGINTPEQQAQLHAEPDPDQGSRGYSPDLERQLAWERAVSGAPAS